MASKASLENGLRTECLTALREFFDDHYGCNICEVSPNELALPVTDAEGNDAWIVVKVSIPRGTRDGNGGYIPYDGYAVAEAYAEECGEKAQKKAEAEAKKQAKIARDEKKRAEKKALAEANKGLKELRNIDLSTKTTEGEST